MADIADTQDVEEKFTEEIELLDGQARQEDLDTLLIEDKDVDQIDPDIVLGEKDDLLDAGGEDDQFEVLDCVGESSSEDKKDVQTEKNDKEDSFKGEFIPPCYLVVLVTIPTLPPCEWFTIVWLCPSILT